MHSVEQFTSQTRTKQSIWRSASIAAVVIASLVTTTACAAAASKATDQKVNEKKQAAQKKVVIEIGWDAPTPNFVRANIKTMEKRPLRGTMINLNAGKTIFNKTPYPDKAFEQDRADLQATKSSTLNRNFVTMWSAREHGWDWFNDSHWQAAEQNARNLAKTLAAGKTVRGIAFDPEPYGTDPWAYNATLYPNKSLSDVRAIVRKRGAAFMQAVQTEKPDIEILTLFGMSLAQAEQATSGSIDGMAWVLLPAFIDGMLDVIGPDVKLIDGNESSYYYTKPTDFDWGRGEFTKAGKLVAPENRAKYTKHVQYANAVFVDGLLNLLQSPRFFGYFIASDAQRRQVLEHHLYYGLKTSDEYVWIYNEAPNWWGSLNAQASLPEGLEAVIRNASAKVNSDKPLGFDPSRC